MIARKAAEGGRRDYVLQVLVNNKELEELKQLAEAAGCSSLSEYVRQAALGYRHADRRQLESNRKETEEEQQD